MRFQKLLLLLTLGFCVTLSAQTSAPPRMSEEMKKLLVEARELRMNQRFTEALAKLDEAEKLDPTVPDTYALRGDIHLLPRRRDFDLALPQFQKAVELQPDSPLPKFNLAEFYFVKHDFQTSLDMFTKLAADFPKLPMLIRHLVHYKRVLCELKLGNRAKAEAIIAEHFTFMDDTPAYYFSNAALSFDAANLSKAQEWVQRGVAAFKAGPCEPYYDSFKELRWVPDMDFGGATEVPQKKP